MTFLTARGWREKLHWSKLNHSLFSSSLISLIFGGLEIPLLLCIRPYARQGTFTNTITFSPSFPSFVPSFLQPFLFFFQIYSHYFASLKRFFTFSLSLDFLLWYSWWLSTGLAFPDFFFFFPSLNKCCLSHEVCYLSKRTVIRSLVVCLGHQTQCLEIHWTSSPPAAVV